MKIVLLFLILFSGCYYCDMNQSTEQNRSEVGKRRCVTLCKAIDGWHTAHGPKQCICKDKDGCTTIFTSKVRKNINNIDAYNYVNPRTIGKCTKYNDRR